MYPYPAADTDAFLPAPACRKNRLLWPLCALLLSAFVLLAMPGARIQLGASRLKGLVGSYTGHGNWHITVAYSGSDSITTQPNGATHGTAIGILANSPNSTTSGTYDLANYNNSPTYTETGGLTANIHNYIAFGTYDGNPNMQLTMGGSVTYTLTWLPENNNLSADPAPRQVVVFYRRTATASTSTGTGGGVAQSTATVSSDSVTARAASNMSVNNSEPFVKEILSSNGTATKTFSVNSNLNMNLTHDSSNTLLSATAESYNKIDFCVSGFNTGRFGSSLKSMSGGNNQGGTDPTYTRWLPLAFSPQMSSYPFRYQAGALPGPWGNINCMYSLSVRQELLLPNLDLNGSMLDILPGPGADGTYNNPGPPYIPMKPVFVPGYSIIDANGDRVVFSASNGPFSDVHSTLVNQGNGVWQLTKAGPPGAIRQKGNYTYTFQQTNPPNTSPLQTQLISIQDDLGNTQTLNWIAGGYMTVNDSSSLRRLVFSGPAGGYFTSVDAPEPGGGPHTHTTLTYDSTGHCTAVNVYAGGSSLLLHSDTFTYGGPNGDSVTTAQQGVSTTSFNYATDTYGLDPFGLAIPRLTSTTYGAAGDSSSSDDGGSVAGTVSYGFGPTQLGYNNWGMSSHVNTVTDARGNTYTTVLGLTGDVYGDITSVLQYAPDYAGAPVGKNTALTYYNPGAGHPQQITSYDPIIASSPGAKPWQAYFDLLQNLTQITDPLGNAWKFGYTDDGIHLASITDPTNIWLDFAYGERGNPASRLTTLSSSGAGATQIDYNAFGQPTAITTPAASSASGQIEKTQFTFDNTTGDLTRVTNPLGDILGVSGYDALGDPLGAILYPDTGNPATSTQPLATTINYDAAQMPTDILGPNGVTLHTTFTNGAISGFQTLNQGQMLTQMTLNRDTRGRVYKASDTTGILAQYRYDKNSNVTQIWDGKGNITRFLYGNCNEAKGVQWPDGAVTSIAYDAGGRVRQTLDERSIVCTYVYNGTSHLTDILWPNYPAENVHYTYDNAGRLLTVTDSSGSRTYQYDPMTGRLNTVVTVYSGLPQNSNTITLTYGYYNDGKLAWRTGLGGTTLYHYNAAGQLTQVTDPQNNTTTYNYDHIGRTLGQSTTTATSHTFATTCTWGVSGLVNDPSTAPVYLRQISNAFLGQTWNYTLTHNLLGQVQRQDEGSVGAGVSGYAQFGYDGRGRLNAEQLHWQANAQTAYNLAGNYTSDVVNNTQPAGANWPVNSSNQVTPAPSAGNAGLVGATGLAYDTAGNVTGLNGATLGYSAWGDLSSAGGATYGYNSAGRRIRKTVGGVTTYYAYDGGTLIGELDGSGNLTRRYEWGALGLISDLTYSGGSVQTRLYGFDALGNTRVLVDGGTGTVLWQGSWTAWGLPNGSTAPPTPLGYKGQTGAYLDSESGLIRMGCRYYAPCVGRFLSRDPSGFAAGANLYAFCMADPVNFFDPSGCGPVSVGSLFRQFCQTAEAAGALDMPFMGNQSVHSLQQIHDDPMGALKGLNPLEPLLGLPASTERAGTAQGYYDGNKISGAQLACAYVDFGEHFAGSVMILAGESEGTLPCGKGGPKCFVAGTPVWVAMQDKAGKWQARSKAIETVKQGEYVLARNEQTGKTSVQKVLRTTVKHADVTVSVTLADKSGQAVETITTTREHPFYVNGKGFVPAGGLGVGNSIVEPARRGCPPRTRGACRAWQATRLRLPRICGRSHRPSTISRSVRTRSRTTIWACCWA